MRNTLYTLLLALLCTPAVHAQTPSKAKNVIVFLMDGYRWRELFMGADSSILFDHRYNHEDSAWTVAKYWANTPEERRHKLMPFVWETIARQGRLYGNRQYGNLVNVQNTYWFSYPGRNEAFTGHFDTLVNSNEYPDNPHTNVLEYINTQPGLHGKVVTFASWDAVARILNRNRNGMLVNIYGEDIQGDHLTPMEQQANVFQHTLPDLFGKGERLDAGTYALAKAYLLANHPRVLYIDLGDNDDFGHAGEYGDYLDAAHYADAMFRDIWTTIQSDPFYKDQTAMLIFPDHGRGEGAGWTSHGTHYPHSNETYLMAIGAGVDPRGEIKTPGQIYEAQYAQTIAQLLGFRFTAEHPVAEGVRF